MKFRNAFHTRRLFPASALLFFPLAAMAQTVEIDPAGAIPATHDQVFATEWNSDGNSESWTTNGFSLDSGAPTSGILTGIADNGDPQLNRNGLNVASSTDTIVEFRIRKESADDSRIDLFWGDDSGGISGARVVAINNPPFIADDTFHVVRITFSGQLNGNLSEFRFDVASDAAGVGRSISVDYFRIYSVLPAASLAWDPGVTGSGTVGGSGNWNTSSNFWWNGSSQTSWPAISSGLDEATFAGAAGIVTIKPTGITASTVNFNTGGYILSGGALTLDGSALLRSPGGTTTINAPLAGSAPIVVATGGIVIKQPGNQTNSTRFNNLNTGASVNNAFGTGAVILGNGGNVFFSSLSATRTHSNNFEWRGNRLIIDNGDLGTGLGAFPLVINGGLLLAGQAPSDFFLRRALTVNGVVSGTGPDGRSLFFQGDSEVMTLNSAANTFTGTITWANDTTLAVVADGGLGDSTNGLAFNGGGGTVKMLAAFNSSRVIAVNGDTVARIDTNGFDSTWSGGITGTNGNNSRFYKIGTGKLTLGGVNFLGGGTQVRQGTLELPAGASLTHSGTWDNNHGVSGGATMLLNGGSMLVDGSFYAVGNGINPASEALFQINSGDYTHNGGAILVGFSGNGRFVMNGGSAVINQLNYGDGDSARIAIAELNGGTLTMDQADRRGGDSMATIKLNGTTLTARSDKADYLPVGSAGTTQFLVGTGGAKFDTAGHSIAVINPLLHDSSVAGVDGGLVKFNAGTLTLSGINTYTGDTVVNGGTLAVSGNSIPNTNKLVINAAKVEPTGIETVGTLFFGSTQQASGTWGSTSSAATHQNNTYFSGTGVVNVTSGAAGYAAWISGFVVADSTPNGDPDSDGIKNLMEYVLNGNPGTSSTAILPAQNISGANYVFSFTRRAESPGDTTQVFQYGSNLSAWTDVAITAGPQVVIGASSGGLQLVTVTVPKTGVSMFGRLQATQP